MIRAAALLLALAGPGLAEGAAARMDPCLRETDAEFRRSTALDLADRWARLEVLAAGESRCLVAVTTACTKRGVGAACFDDVLAWAAPARRAAVLQLPEAMGFGPPTLVAGYAQWREQALAALDHPTFAGCPLADDAPPAACAALEAGTGFLRARDWARMIAVIDEVAR